MLNQQQQKVTPDKSQQTINRGAEMDELNFEDDAPTPSFGEPETEADRGSMSSTADEDINSSNDISGSNIDISSVGLTGAAQPGDEPTDDDMSPETLIREDGARSPQEPGGNTPADKQLSNVGENEIGGGGGLDEAELARARPLDRKKWDGNPDDRLSSAQSYAEGSAPAYEEDIDLDEEE